MHPSAILVLCLALTASSIHARTLSQGTPNCSAFSSAGASSESRSAVVSAITQAFAQCSGSAQDACKANFKGSQCETTALAQAKAAADVSAKAVTSVFAQVASTSPTCVADASALASAKSVAEGLAIAIAQATSQGCNKPEITQKSEQIKQIFVTAATNSQAYAKTNGVGNAEAFNLAYAEDVRPIIAESLSLAIATCNCGQGGAAVGTGTTAGAGQGQQTTGSQSGANTNGGSGSTQNAGASGSAQTSCVQRPANLPAGFQLTGGLTFCP